MLAILQPHLLNYNRNEWDMEYSDYHSSYRIIAIDCCDATGFIATCMCVPVGLNGLASV